MRIRGALLLATVALVASVDPGAGSPAAGTVTVGTATAIATADDRSFDVLSRSCAPIANARVDFWQADGNGTYDNSGYTLRGYQLTDTQGRYQLDTVIPGLYPGRTEHIHVKVTPPGSATTTSQLFFPGVTQNQSDSIFSQAMLVTLTPGTRGPAPGTPFAGRFDFIVNIP